MSVTSAIKAFFHSAISHPLAGFIRAEDRATKLDVVVSEIVDLNVMLGDGENNADIVSYEGERSLRVVLGYKPTFIVHLDVTNQSGTVGYMLIDLSDTVNWPHENTAHIILQKVVIQSSQTTSPAFLGNIQFGFLSNVDGNNGDFHRIGALQGDRSTPIGAGIFDFSNYGLGLELDEWFGPTTLNDTTWQTDVNLLGPDGNTSYPAGDGDFVCKLASSAGAISFGLTVVYTTAED